MVKMKNLGLVSVVLLGMALGSCSKDNDVNGDLGGTPHQLTIATRQVAYEGTGQELAGENTITDMKACVFEKGIMTKVFENLQPASNGYNLQIDSYDATVYMVANADGLLNLQQMHADGISEDKWKATTIGLKENKAANVFTGMLTLNGENQTSQTLTLKRGVARFDLNVDVAGTASIESLTIKNVAQSGYLLPQNEGVKSPENVTRKDMTVAFDTPLTASTPAVLYVYEQENKGLEVSINAVIDGQPKVLTKALEGNLKRNAIYTITVRKNDIDIVVKVGIEDWEPGDDTEIIPQL